MKAGIHHGRATQWHAGYSGEKNTPGVFVMFEIVDGDCRGESISWCGWLTDNAARRTIESLRYMGWKGNDLDKLDTITANVVDLDVQPETDREGRERLRVCWVNPLGGSVQIIAPLATEADKRAFASRFRDIAATVTGAPEERQRRQASGGSGAGGGGGQRGNGGGGGFGGGGGGRRSEPDRDDRPPPGDDDLPF